MATERIELEERVLTYLEDDLFDLGVPDDTAREVCASLRSFVAWARHLITCQVVASNHRGVCVAAAPLLSMVPCHACPLHAICCVCGCVWLWVRECGVRRPAPVAFSVHHSTIPSSRRFAGFERTGVRGAPGRCAGGRRGQGELVMSPATLRLSQLARSLARARSLSRRLIRNTQLISRLAASLPRSRCSWASGSLWIEC